MVDLDSGSHGKLLATLAEAQDVSDACQAAADHLVDVGFTMPSIYLYRGGRLRCYAVRGYWQVYDGMPASAGVIGRCFSSGETVEVRAVHQSKDYLAAVPDVRAEVCVPLRIDGLVVGALNLESLTALPDDTAQQLLTVANSLGDRLSALGGIPRESAYQRLAVHAQRFAGATDEEELQQLVVAAALDLSQLDTAVLALQTGTQLSVRLAAGALEDSLRQIDQEILRLFQSWVPSGTSCYSVNDASGQVFVGHEQVRQSGAQTVVVVPLTSSTGDLGLLIVADTAAVPPSSSTVEVMELLGALTATSLRTVRALEQLRRQATRDPLTGLGHAGSFRKAITEAMAATSPHQVAVAVMDIDRFKAVNDESGHLAGDELLKALSQVLASALPEPGCLYRIGGDEFAAILNVADVSDADALAQGLIEAARREGGRTVSLGLAVAEPGESASDIVRRADQAMYRAKRAGRNTYRFSRPTTKAVS